ncbi:MAG: hypothetical protein ACKVJU_12980 [Verrucomicrobiales bacterium]
MTSSVAYAEHLLASGKSDLKSDDLVKLVRYFCKSSRVKVDRLFREVSRNADAEGHVVARIGIE